MNLIAKVKLYFKKRRFEKMLKLAEEFELSVVKLREVAGTLYMVNHDGSHLKVGKTRTK